MIYPLKFIPIYKTKIWGGNKISKIKSNDDSIPKYCGESWELSSVQDDVSIVANGFLAGNPLNDIIEIYMGELVGDSVFEKFSYEFPILLKIIDANDILSIQVHPDDEIAYKRHKARGKAELWYILESDENAKLYTGFNKNMTQEETFNNIQNGEINKYINQPLVKRGEVYNISPGLIHSIDKGTCLVEIQETSDLTYRVFDHGRQGRELHWELAKDIINYNKTNVPIIEYSKLNNKTNEIIANEHFCINYLSVNTICNRDYFHLDSFVIYFCIEGSLIIDYGEDKISLVKGETILIPAAIKSINIIPENNKTELLEIYMDI